MQLCCGSHSIYMSLIRVKKYLCTRNNVECSGYNAIICYSDIPKRAKCDWQNRIKSVAGVCVCVCLIDDTFPNDIPTQLISQHQVRFQRFKMFNSPASVVRPPATAVSSSAPSARHCASVIFLPFLVFHLNLT